MERLAHEDEIRLEAVGKAAQLPQVIRAEAVGHVQPQPVNVKFLHPGADGVELVLYYRGIVQVQLHQLIVALPGLIPEAVVKSGVAVKAQVEPVLIGAVPFLFLHVPECPEAAPHMVENAVQHHPQAGGMERAANLLEILIGPQTAIQGAVVPGVIAVPVALKKGVKEDRVRAHGLDMFNPVQHPPDPGDLHPVIIPGGAAQAKRIDLVNDRFVKPHNILSPSRRFAGVV